MLGALVEFFWVSLVFFALYLAGVVSLHGGLGPVNQTRNLVRDMLPHRRKDNLARRTEIPVVAVPVWPGDAGSDYQD